MVEAAPGKGAAMTDPHATANGLIMADHNIKELERQYQSARAKAKAADMAARDALNRLNDAKCALKMQDFADMGGVVGVTRVRAECWFKEKVDMKIGPFFVTGACVYFGNVRFKLAKIKKDGTASQASPGVEPTKVSIIATDQP